MDSELLIAQGYLLPLCAVVIFCRKDPPVFLVSSYGIVFQADHLSRNGSFCKRHNVIIHGHLPTYSTQIFRGQRLRV